MGGGGIGPSSGSSEESPSSTVVSIDAAIKTSGGWTSADTKGIGPSELAGVTGPSSVELSESDATSLGIVWLVLGW